jgi:hypothetical protein
MDTVGDAELQNEPKPPSKRTCGVNHAKLQNEPKPPSKRIPRAPTEPNYKTNPTNHQSKGVNQTT